MDSQGHDLHTVFETGDEMAHQLSIVVFTTPIMAHPDAEGRHQLLRRDAPLLLKDLNG